MTLEEFMKHASDAAFVGDADLLRGYAKQIFDERDALRERLEEREADMHARIRAGYDATIADSWRIALARVEAEREGLKAEIEMLRGVGCREAKEGEPESGPCGVCLRCAEERGATWAIRAKAQVVYSLAGDAAYSLLAREVCNKAREKR